MKKKPQIMNYVLYTQLKRTTYLQEYCALCLGQVHQLYESTSNHLVLSF